MGWRWMACGLITLWTGALCAETAPLPPEWRTLVRRLNAEDFAARQTAERELMQQPEAAALPWLVEIARQNDPEASLRASRILDRWLATAPIPLADQAEESLEDLARDANPRVAKQARDSLAVHHELRAGRALPLLIEMGAKIDFAPHRRVMYEQYNVAHAQVDVMSREAAINRKIEPVVPDEVLGIGIFGDEARPAEVDAEPAADPRQTLPKSPRQIWFTRRWTGGDEGVRQLRRLANPDDAIAINVVAGTTASLEAVREATAEFEQLDVAARGPSLGVAQSRSFFGREDCVVDEVLPGGAAEQCGIQPHDVIVECGQAPIEDFRSLIRQIGTYEAGDEIEIKLYRGYRPLTLKAKLGDWTDVDTESRLWQVDPRFR